MCQLFGVPGRYTNAASSIGSKVPRHKIFENRLPGPPQLRSYRTNPKTSAMTQSGGSVPPPGVIAERPTEVGLHRKESTISAKLETRLP